MIAHIPSGDIIAHGASTLENIKEEVYMTKGGKMAPNMHI